VPDRIVLYHNARCSKSRAALELLRAHGAEVHVVEYLHTPPDLDRLLQLHAALGRPARDMLRSDAPEYAELGLDDPACSDARMLEALAAHPHLLQRPIALLGDRAVIGRPPEAVFDLIATGPGAP
jgi:arsenate reductase (glutaredoxin)